MDTGYVELNYWQVTIAVSLLLINGVISLVLELGLAQRLLISAARGVVQLLLVGLVLKWIFSADHPIVVLGWGALITLIAGISAVQRSERRFRGIWWSGIVSVWVSSWLVMAIALGGIVRAQPWYLAQYSIPLLGMMLGNMLNGLSLALDRTTTELVARRDRVEMLLALGATRWEAAQIPIREGVRTGMLPTINLLSVVGIVSLPGMMTGQLLAGVDPVNAVKYQLVILFLIAASTALGTVGVVLLSYRLLFNADHQFLYQRISRRKQAS